MMLGVKESMKKQKLNNKGLMKITVDMVVIFLFVFVIIGLFFFASRASSFHIQKVTEEINFQNVEIMSLSLMNFPVENNNLNGQEDIGGFISVIGDYINFSKDPKFRLDNDYKSILNNSIEKFYSLVPSKKFLVMILDPKTEVDKLSTIYNNARDKRIFGRVKYDNRLYYFFEVEDLQTTMVQEHQTEVNIASCIRELKELSNTGEKNSIIRRMEIPVIIDGRQTKLVLLLCYEE